MKNRELKKILNQFPDNCEVVVPSSNFELNYSLVALKHPPQLKKFKKTTKEFRDAFDFEYYDADVYVSDDKKGKNVIVIRQL